MKNRVNTLIGRGGGGRGEGKVEFLCVTESSAGNYRDVTFFFSPRLWTVPDNVQ